MARWRLRSPHYLQVPGTEWEYKETDQASGRQGRKIFEVPMFLNPEVVADHNYPGEIIVADKPSGRDIVFIGDPTPDMEPLDDEAREISDSFKRKWVNPIEEINMNYGMNYSQSLLDRLEKQMGEIQAGQAPTPRGVSADDFAKLQAQVEELAKQNAELRAEKPLRRI